MNKGISKKQSTILYGIAILLMVYHHLFCIPERLHTDYISFWKIIGIPEFERYLAWFCKICVGIYAFISGYGFCRSFSTLKYESLRNYLYKSFSIVLKHLFKFMKKFWIVFLIFMPMGFVANIYDFNIKKVLFCFLGIRIGYNGEWWYVTQYIYMLFLLPCVHLCFEFIVNNRTRNLNVFCFGIIMFILYAFAYKKLWIEKTYIFIFLIGYISARLEKNKKLNSYILIKHRFLSSTFIFIFCFILRSVVADSASYCKIDIFIIPIFIYAVSLITWRENKVTKTLEFFGKYSTYMWLTHTFICYYYFQPFITISKFSSIMYIEVVLLSLGIAYILSWIEKKIDVFIGVVKEKVHGTD